MRYLLVILLLSSFAHRQTNVDYIIRNGKIIDGTGNSWFYADVVIDHGQIVFIGNAAKFTAYKIVDATGLVVAPGFIDVHTHIEGDERANPLATNFIYDGVTTVITGNCGSSTLNLKQYFTMLDSLHLSINVASLIGHNDVRRQVMGRANRDAAPNEIVAMEAIVRQGMIDGAVGLSTGLEYIPGAYAKTNELIALAKIAAAYNGVYATHMRNEGDSVAQSIAESILIGREANIPVELSHFKVSGQQNWGRSIETLLQVKRAREEGIDVTIDQYPYTASSTSLSTRLPEWVLADGQDSIVARLAKPAIRKAVTKEMLANLKKRKLKHYAYAVVANYKTDTTLNGKSIEAINKELGRKHTAASEVETILQMVEKGGAAMVFHGMGEPDVQTIMKYPFSMFASDASIRIFNQGVPHPRGYGTNARVLAKYVRDEKVISLEEAIRRMTSLPAQKFHVENRGLIKAGYAADIVLFDEKLVQDNATYANPHQYASGFKYVFVNGKLTLDNGMHNNTRAGQTLRQRNY